MAGYQGMENERRIPAEPLHRFVGEIFKGAGLSGAHAELMAEIIVHTDARGIYSHGSQAVAGYVDRLLSGKINPKGQPRIEQEHGAVIIVDGDCAMGHIACVFGMRAAIDRARKTGVALAAIRNSNHCGAMSYYPTLAMAEEMVGSAVRTRCRRWHPGRPRPDRGTQPDRRRDPVRTGDPDPAGRRVLDRSPRQSGGALSEGTSTP